MSVELRIKAKHLALEPAIIRKEEQKILKQIRSGYCNDTMKAFTQYESLVNHRKWNVRNEARATHLARAFIEGKSYSSIEKKVHDESVLYAYIIPRIIAMVAKYGRQEDRIYKRWNQTLRRMEFPLEDYDLLQQKIKTWIERE